MLSYVFAGFGAVGRIIERGTFCSFVLIHSSICSPPLITVSLILHDCGLLALELTHDRTMAADAAEVGRRGRACAGWEHEVGLGWQGARPSRVKNQAR